MADRFQFSLHLPDPLCEADEDLVAATRDFVSLYVLHPPSHGDSASPLSWRALVESWRSRYGDDFLLEYTGAPAFAAAETALPGLPLCADTGSLLKDGLSPAFWMAERKGRIREIHLHGLSGAKDHCPLRAQDSWIEELGPFLLGFEGRVELELFSLAGAEGSRDELERYLMKAPA